MESIRPASPKRAEKRHNAFQQHLLHAGSVEDLQKAKLAHSSMLAGLRRAKFSSTRVVDLIQVIRAVDRAEKRARLEDGVAPAPRSLNDFKLDVAVHKYGDEVEARQGQLRSCGCNDGSDEGDEEGKDDMKTNKAKVQQLRALAQAPCSWRVARLRKDRHLSKGGASELEYVLFAEVALPSAWMQASPKTTWLEVVPRAYYASEACEGASHLQRAERASPEQKRVFDAILMGVWVDTTFRGVRSLFERINELYLGIGIADVSAFVRKQELKQMSAPRVAGVVAPLVATELGWHQIDIMYATWDTGESKEEKAKKVAADAQGDPTLRASQQERYDDRFRAAKKRELELRSLFSKTEAEIAELKKKSNAIVVRGLNHTFAGELKGVTAGSLRRNTAWARSRANPQKAADIGDQLELLTEWRGDMQIPETSASPRWTIKGWLPIADSTFSAAQIKKLIELYLSAPSETVNVQYAFAGPVGEEVPHTPLSPSEREQYVRNQKDTDDKRLLLEKIDTELDDVVRDINVWDEKKRRLFRKEDVSDSEVSSEGEEEDEETEELEGGARATRSQGAVLPRRKDNPEPARRGAATRHYPYVLNIMDIFSKYAWCFPLRDQSSRSVTKILSELWLREGAPTKLQSDGGFKSDELKHLAERFNVRLERCAPYHSQCSGAIERLNRTIRESVRNMKHVYGRQLAGGKWANYLPNIAASYNSQKHSTTGLSPFHVQRGFAPRALKPLHYMSSEEMKQVQLDPLVEVDRVAASTILQGGDSCAVFDPAVYEGAANMIGGATHDSLAEQKFTEASHTAAEVTKLVHASFDELPSAESSGYVSEKALIARYMAHGEQAATVRNDFVRRGIRHGAMGMMTDALIKAEDSMKRLDVGALVRVSLQHMSKEVRSEIKVGMKRAQDLNTWSSTIFWVMQQPIETWLGAEGSAAPPSSQTSRIADAREGKREFSTLYTVAPCLMGRGDVLRHDPLFVPRQDLLLVSRELLTVPQMRALKRGDTKNVEDQIRKLVGLRDDIPALETFH